MYIRSFNPHGNDGGGTVPALSRMRKLLLREQAACPVSQSWEGEGLGGRPGLVATVRTFTRYATHCLTEQVTR